MPKLSIVLACIICLTYGFVLQGCGEQDSNTQSSNGISQKPIETASKENGNTIVDSGNPPVENETSHWLQFTVTAGKNRIISGEPVLLRIRLHNKDMVNFHRVFLGQDHLNAYRFSLIRKEYVHPENPKSTTSKLEAKVMIKDAGLSLTPRGGVQVVPIQEIEPLNMREYYIILDRVFRIESPGEYIIRCKLLTEDGICVVFADVPIRVTRRSPDDLDKAVREYADKAVSEYLVSEQRINAELLSWIDCSEAVKLMEGLAVSHTTGKAVIAGLGRKATVERAKALIRIYSQVDAGPEEFSNLSGFVLDSATSMMEMNPGPGIIEVFKPIAEEIADWKSKGPRDAVD